MFVYVEACMCVSDCVLHSLTLSTTTTTTTTTNTEENCKEAQVQFEEPHSEEEEDADDGVCARATLKADEADETPAATADSDATLPPPPPRSSSSSSSSGNIITYEFFKGIAIAVIP